MQSQVPAAYNVSAFSAIRGAVRRSGTPHWRVLFLVALAIGGLSPLDVRTNAAAVAQDAAAEEESEEEGRFTVIRARRIIPIEGKDIENGVVVIANGKIRNVGRGLEYPGNAKVIDATDRVVMPGLIDPISRFGLPNYSRTGVHGDLNVADEHFPTKRTYDPLLEAGYTAIALTPAGSEIPGRALVTRIAGPIEARVLASPGYLMVRANKRSLRSALEKAKQEIEKVDKARTAFEEQQKQAAARESATQPVSQASTHPAAAQPASAPATQPAFTPPKIDPAYQALVDLIQEKPDIFAVIELERASDYLHLLDLLKTFKIAHRLYFNSFVESDLDYVRARLGENKEQVILRPYLNRMSYSAEYILLSRELSEAGCEVSLTTAADNVYEYRAIFQRLAELVRAGWKRENALQSVTKNPAKLLGLDDRFGTIEKGKIADLIFLDADPMRPGARVREIMINGEIVHRVKDGD